MTGPVQFDIRARDQASSELAKVGRNVEALADKLDRLGAKTANPKVTLDSTQAQTRLQQFNQALGQLSNKRIRVDVDINGTQQVGDLRRELSYMTDRKVKIRVDTADSNQRLKTITDRLALIRDTKAKVDVQVTGDNRLDDLGDKLSRLERFSPLNLRVELDAAGVLGEVRAILDALIILDGYTARPRVELDGATAAIVQLTNLLARLRQLDGNTSTATVTIREQWDRSLEGRISGIIRNFLAIPAAASVASAGMGVVGAAAFSLAGGLAEAAGAAGLLPGALAAGGAVFATVQASLVGMDDAFKALGKGDMEAFAEALKGMSAEGAQFAQAARDMQPALQALRVDVQAAMFRELGNEVRQLGTAYFPSLRSGMTGIATELNAATRGVTDFLQSGEAVSRVDSIFRSTTQAVANIAPAADDVTAAFLDVAEVGAAMLPELTQGAEGAAAGFRTFVAAARESGQLEAWIQTGIDRLVQLGDIAGNVGGVLGGVFTAATAEGADFLTLLQQGTQALDEFVNSAQGQSALSAFFRESRETVDALIPGLVAARDAVVGFMEGFDQTDGLATFAGAISDAVVAVGPLVAQLGELAGGTLGVLGASLSNVATALGPVASGLGGLLDVIGPIGPAVLGMVAAFAGLSLVSGYLAAASTAMAGAALSAGVYTESMLLAAGANASFAASAGTRVASAATAAATALGAVGRALPLVGVAVVGLTAIYQEFGSTVDENASKVVQGSQSIREAIIAEQAQVEHGMLFWISAEQQKQAYAQAADDVRAAIEAELQAMGRMDELQARVAISQANYNDAVAEFSPASDQAAEAARVLAIDQGNLEQAQDDARIAAKLHQQGIEDLADEMSSAIGAGLDYEESIRRTAEAQKDAEQALKDHGASSQEYQTEVTNLARSQEAQALAAQRVAEANGSAADGARAYATELLKMNNGTQAGRDALLKLAANMTDVQISAFNAASAATGLNTEVVKLPNGKEIRLVVAGDTSALPTIQQQIKSVTDQEYLGVVTINGDATNARGEIYQSVEFANGQTGTIKVNADGSAVTATVDGQKYYIDQTTGTLKIDGDPKPGIANLDGFIATVNASGAVTSIDANPQPAEGKLAALVGTIDTTTGTITIDGDPSFADGKTVAAVAFADGSRGTIAIDGNQAPVNGKVEAAVTYADGSVGTITLDANDQRVLAAQANARLPISSLWTPAPNTGAVDDARDRIARPISVDVVYRQRVEGTAPMTGGPARGGFALGGVVAPGGVQLFAGGGTFLGHRLRPMAAGQAAAVPPNTWRVVGDRSDVNESYIPWKRNDRSLGLLDVTARALGRAVVPLALGGLLRFAPGGVAAPGPAPASSSSTAAPVLDEKYAEALKAASEAGAELNDMQALVVDTATQLADQSALTTTQVAALTVAAQTATTVDEAYRVGLDAVRLASDTVTAAAQIRTAAEQVATDATATALGQANAYTGGLTTLGQQAGGATTGGIQTLTGAVTTETGTEGTALGQAQAYTGGLTALGQQAGGATTGGIQALTGAVTASGGASVTATGQAQGHTTQLGALGTQAGGATTAGLNAAQTAAQAQGAASAAAGAQAQGQAGDLQALATSAGTAAGELQGVATAVNNLPDGEFIVTATGRMGEITGTPTVRAATGAVLPGWSPGRDIHSFYSPTAGRLELSGGEAVMRPEWTAAMGPAYVDAANKAAREGTLHDFLARTAPREGQRGGDGSMLATGGVWWPKTKDVGRFALGGTIGRLGNPFPPMPTDLWETLAARMADAMTPAMQAAVKAEEEKLAGGPALEWARSQVGKPYLWGGVGPAGYDCSGFMSAILNVMQGKPPHSRVGSTANFPWAGFQPGIGGSFSIGAFRGDPGHMAGTLNGTNVESSGSVGVRVGGGARGAGDGMFTIRAHVKDGGILPNFDRGGLAIGTGLLAKQVIKPERILDARTTAAFERLVPTLQAAGRVQLGAPSVVTGTGGYRGADPAAVAAVVQSQVNQAVTAVREMAAEMLARPAITVNDVSGNPTETARAVNVAHRLARR